MKMKNIWPFYKTLLKNPRQVGAAFPSSKYLANAMASFVPATNNLIVELGPGTGAVTHALLNKNIKSNQIIAIEQSEMLVNKLNHLFPGLTVLHGDATELKKLLAEYQQPIDVVVSSLPLLSLSSEITKNILQQVEMILNNDGLFIQYTYGMSDSWSRHFKKMKRVANKRIWRNIPPAQIYVYRANK